MAEKIDIREDEEFCKMLMARRAALLADVKGIEIFFGMELTNKLRDEVKQLRHELKVLKNEA